MQVTHKQSQIKLEIKMDSFKRTTIK